MTPTNKLDDDEEKGKAATEGGSREVSSTCLVSSREDIGDIVDKNEAIEKDLCNNPEVDLGEKPCEEEGTAAHGEHADIENQTGKVNQKTSLPRSKTHKPSAP